MSSAPPASSAARRALTTVAMSVDEIVQHLVVAVQNAVGDGRRPGAVVRLLPLGLRLVGRRRRPGNWHLEDGGIRLVAGDRVAVSRGEGGRGLSRASGSAAPPCQDVKEIADEGFFVARGAAAVGGGRVGGLAAIVADVAFPLGKRGIGRERRGGARVAGEPVDLGAGDGGHGCGHELTGRDGGRRAAVAGGRRVDEGLVAPCAFAKGRWPARFGAR